MSHPHPHFGNAPHNVVQRRPYAQFTVRCRQLNLRRAIFRSREDIYAFARNADVISSGAEIERSDTGKFRNLRNGNKKIRECINNLFNGRI